MENVLTPPARILDYTGNYVGSRPYRVNERTNQVQVLTSRGLVVNSQLRLDEWRKLDMAIQQAATTRLRLVRRLRELNLVEPVTSIGTLTVQYTQASEITAAETNMEGRSGQTDRGRADHKIAGSPLPVTFKEFEIPMRQLEASRMGGNPIDTSNAERAARVVAEQLESLAVDGQSSLVFDSNTLYGVTSEPNILTDTAANYGGGDWGTISNIIPTIEGMITALTATTNNYYGPFDVFAARTQYNQAALNHYADVGDTPAQRIRNLDMVQNFDALDYLADGEILVMQMTPDVIKWYEHVGISVLEWMSGDGMVGFYKVVSVAAPQPRSEYNSRSGICLATGA